MSAPPRWPDGCGLRRYAVLDSTNEEARRLAASGERGPLWIMARIQTKGRGRRGRAWVSEEGNLFATLLMRAPRERAGELGFVAALATAQTITALAPGLRPSLKWPNDVLLQGRKVAGILLESGADDALAVGIGINLATHPSGTEFPAVSLAALRGTAPDPGEALLHLAGAMAACYEVWQAYGFAPVRAAWQALAIGLKGPIRARLAENEMEGVFEDLDEDGALLLRCPSGVLRRITAGDVFFQV